MNREGILYTTVFTFIVSFFFVVLLSFVSGYTEPLSAANREAAETEAKRRAVGEREDSSGVVVKRYSGAGLWGEIAGYIAFDSEKSRLVGISVVSQNETPGLGGRIEEEWFLAQFSGERIGPEPLALQSGGSPGGDSDRENSSIDAISGATLTSRAFMVIVNEEIDRFFRGE